MASSVSSASTGGWLLDRWLALSSRLNVPTAVQTEWWAQLSSSYSATHRHYHTLAHLEDLFKGLDSTHTPVLSTDSIGAAIFFHDFVYDGKATGGKNEDDSISKWKEFAQQANLEADFLTKVALYIEATKHHKVKGELVDETQTPTEESDLAIFLDLDMSVLGRSVDGYVTYAQQIRREYIHYPEDGYRKGRSTFLRNFLGSPIFATKEFRTRLEEAARTNIAYEIEWLEDPSRPLLAESSTE